MKETAPTGDVLAHARRRAAASRRRRTLAAAIASVAAAEPPVALSSGPLGVVQAADREIARLTAVQARAVAEFAESRPATVDRAQGEKGAMSAERWAARPELLKPVSEWATPELRVALSRTHDAAETLLQRSLTLVYRLPATLAALEAGVLHVGHLWPLLTHVAPIEDDGVRAEVEALLLAFVGRRERVTTPAQLGAKTRREVLQRDARAATRRLERAIKERGVFLRAEEADGMASVTAVLTMPEAQALYRTLCALVDALDEDPDDARTRGQKLADILLDLVLRPGEGERPPVQVLLTVVAAMGTLLGGDAPGEIDGHLVPAEMIRHLLQTMTGRQPAPEPPAAARAWQEIEQEELEAWWAETERRLLAGELGGEPEPISDGDNLIDADGEIDPDGLTEADGLSNLDSLFDLGDLVDLDDIRPAGDAAHPDAAHPDAARPDAARPDAARPDAAHPDAVADGAGLADPPPGDAAPQPSPGGVAPNEGPPDQEPAADGRWWVSADRAVSEAGEAVLRAQQALGRARQLVHTARIADLADEADAQDAPGGRVTAATDALGALRAATESQRDWLGALLDATGGGGLAERPRIALTDALSGTLLALTDLPELRRTGCCGARACRREPESCIHDLTGRAGLGAPGPTAGYRPGAALDRWVRARDRRCRFPGCRRRVPKGGELDHRTPYPDGPTSAANLAGFCTTDHRGKHQAPGWSYDLEPDGTLTVTTPTGLTAVTEPPPY